MPKPAHIAERDEIVKEHLQDVVDFMPNVKRHPMVWILALHAVAADVQIATYKRLGHTMPKLEVTDDGVLVEVKDASNL